jgi:23S rRNA pseudouridine1911/1915/1917 synthase
MNIGSLVLYKNNQLIAFNKPPGLAVQPDPTGEKSLLELASIYTKGPVHLLHRIDRPASGVVLFAKTETALVHLNEQFRQQTVQKTYLAIVQKPLPAPAGELVHYLRHDTRARKARLTEAGAEGAKKAVLHYRRRAEGERYDLLEISLFSGRFHQIRAQLASVGCPIRGDVKYGFRRGNKDRSIQLHAWKLRFQHPVSGESELIAAPPPDTSIWQAFTTALSSAD